MAHLIFIRPEDPSGQVSRVISLKAQQCKQLTLLETHQPPLDPSGSMHLSPMGGLRMSLTELHLNPMDDLYTEG